MRTYILEMNQSSRAIKNYIKELYGLYYKSPRPEIIRQLILEWKDKHISKLEEERELCEI